MELPLYPQKREKPKAELIEALTDKKLKEAIIKQCGDLSNLTISLLNKNEICVYRYDDQKKEHLLGKYFFDTKGNLKEYAEMGREINVVSRRRMVS